MNRNIVIGGVVAVAILLGVAAWFFFSGRAPTPGAELAGEPAGPITLNPVTVVTEHSATQSEDGRMLSMTFPKFELVAKGGETTSAVFSTTWRLKLPPQERANVATVSLSGFMKSVGTPPPAPPQPAKPAPAADGTAPAAEGATPATEGTPPATSDSAAAPAGSTPPAEQPATTAPAPAAPAQPVAGDGTARVVVTIGGETSITEWRDWTGKGSDHQLSKAVAYIGTPADMRSGDGVPVTVTIEVAGNTSTETLSRLNSLELRVYAEEAPLPTEPPGTPGTPAEVTPPAESTGTTPPADGTTPPAEGAQPTP
jgi:hypothetical protein